MNYSEAAGMFVYNPETGKITNRINRRKARKGMDSTTPFHGYRRVNVGIKKYLAHRLAWLLHKGHWPEFEIDHINGDKADNRISNLRDVTHAENQKNRRLSKNNTSTVQGVTWSNQNQKWLVRISGTYIGLFSNLEDAALARMTAEINEDYHPNHGNINTTA